MLGRMGSVGRLQQVGGALVIVALAVGLNRVGSHGPQPLRVDHTKAWSYVRTPHKTPSSLERRLGEIASFVAKRPVQVRCEDFSQGKLVEPGGVVQFNGERPADFARLRPDVCSALVHFARETGGAQACVSGGGCDPRLMQSSDAVTVLAHESVHLRGLRDEAVVQCYAMQAVPAVARAFGAQTQDGRAMALLEYTVAYPHMPPAYRSAACRPGGSLDLSRHGEWLR